MPPTGNRFVYTAWSVPTTRTTTASSNVARPGLLAAGAPRLLQPDRAPPTGNWLTWTVLSSPRAATTTPRSVIGVALGLLDVIAFRLWSGSQGHSRRHVPVTSPDLRPTGRGVRARCMHRFGLR